MGICIPLSVIWWTYNKPLLLSSSAVNYWQSLRTKSSSSRQLSTKTNNRYQCLRSAALMNPGVDGIDMIVMKNQCIRSVGRVIRPSMEDIRVFHSDGTGVFVGDNSLLLTCYHVVVQLPVVWVEFVISYENRMAKKCLIKADVVYCEPHCDLALLHLQSLPSEVSDRPTILTITNKLAADKSIGFGAPVAMLGNGNDIHYELHPGMIRTPLVDKNMTPYMYYVRISTGSEQLPIIATNMVTVPGFSGSPAIDINGKLCGLVWGGISERFFISYAIDYKTLSAFFNRAIVYGREGRNQTRLRKRFEWDIQSNRRLMGLIVDSKPFSGCFTVQSALPMASTNAIGIIGRRICLVNGQVCNTVDDIRLAINNRLEIKVTIRSTIDDDSSSDSKDSMKTIDINTIETIDEQDISIMPLVF